MIADSVDEYNVSPANPFFLSAGMGRTGNALGDWYMHQSPVPQPAQPVVGNPDWLALLATALSGVKGMGSLSCGGSCGCGCDKKGVGVVSPETIASPYTYVSPAIANPVDTTGIWSSPLCTWNPYAAMFPSCIPPTPEEVAADTTDYGGMLSTTNQALATQEATYIADNAPSLTPTTETNWFAVGLGVTLLVAAGAWLKH